MSPHELINQDSGKTEYYTDPLIVESARRVLGIIDLDPASSMIANVVVRAKTIFTAKDDGLTKKWVGNVWMNHPFEKCKNRQWIRKLVDGYESGDIKEAICICYASTSEGWFQPLLKFPQCFPPRRTNYFLPDGTKKNGVTKGSVITYLGDRVEDFKREFSNHGTIKVLG